MACFLTPREMFDEQIQRWDAEYQRQKDYYIDQMQVYAIEAEKMIARELKGGTDAYDYIMSVASAIIDGSVWAERIFARLGLNDIHAYAVLEQRGAFEEEFDKVLENRIQSQYD